jgi:hypothetical protein
LKTNHLSILTKFYKNSSKKASPDQKNTLYLTWKYI